MKILLAVDDSLYSRFAAGETAKLAINAFADVTILGNCSKSTGDETKENTCPPAGGHMVETMHAYQRIFLDQGPQQDNPYRAQTEGLEWVAMDKGVWEELRVLRGARKRLRVRLRQNESNQVLAEDAAEDYDLIVLGCGPHGESLPGTSHGGMQKIIENARASVLLVKQDLDIHNLVCCLDTSEVPQRSLEMINLIATIHGATLELLGVTREGWIKMEVDQKLSTLWRYFVSNQSKVMTGFKEHGKLEPFVSHEARPDLLVLWRGKQSILSSLFPKKWLSDLVDKSQSSVLILR